MTAGVAVSPRERDAAWASTLREPLPGCACRHHVRLTDSDASTVTRPEIQARYLVLLLLLRVCIHVL
eukprot:2409845-Rhodomonas_salina.2